MKLLRIVEIGAAGLLLGTAATTLWRVVPMSPWTYLVIGSASERPDHQHNYSGSAIGAGVAARPDRQDNNPGAAKDMGVAARPVPGMDIDAYFGTAVGDELLQRAVVAVSNRYHDDAARALERRIASGALDQSSAFATAEFLAVIKAKDLSYLLGLTSLLEGALRGWNFEPDQARETAYVSIIQRLLEIGEVQSPLAIALEAAAAVPDSVPIQRALAAALAGDGNYSAALRTLAPLIDGSDEACAQYALLLFEHGDTARAAKIASELRQRNPEVAFALGVIPSTEEQIAPGR